MYGERRVLRDLQADVAVLVGDRGLTVEGHRHIFDIQGLEPVHRGDVCADRVAARGVHGVHAVDHGVLGVGGAFVGAGGEGARQEGEGEAELGHETLPLVVVMAGG